MPVRRRAAILVLAAVALGGCVYGHTTAWTEHGTTELVRSRSLQRLGRSDVLEVKVASDAVGVRDERVELCRPTARGVVVHRRERSAQRARAATNGWLWTAVALPGVAMTVLGAVDSFHKEDCPGCAQNRTLYSTSPWLVAGLAELGVTLAAAFTFASLPSRRYEEAADATPMSRWDGAAQACPATVPTPMADQSIDLVAHYQRTDKVLRWQGKTDARGVVVAPVLAPARAVALYCGPGDLTIGQTGAPSQPPPDPPIDAPPATAPRFASFAHVPLAPAAAVSLASLRQQNVAAGALATQCCRDAHKTAFTADCERQCAANIGVLKCLNGRTACLARAARETDRDVGTDYCQTLYGDCLVAHGTSGFDMNGCTNFCAETAASKECA